MASLTSAPIASQWAGRKATLPAQFLRDRGSDPMTHTTNTLRWFICFTLLELLRPILLAGQRSEFVATGDALAASGAGLIADNPVNTTTPSSAIPLGLPWQAYGQHGSSGQNVADTLAYQIDRGATSAWLTETYVAAPAAFAGLRAPEWSNGFAAGATWFLTKSNTNAAHLMANLDSSTTSVGGLPFEQYDGSYLTLRWGLSHLFLSGTGRNDLQIDLAGYGEHMVSPPRLPVAFYMADPTGYAASSSGAEATFSMPSRNAVFSIRYGWEQIVQQPTHSRLLQFQLSWSW